MEGIRTASHVGLWIMVISLGIFLAWSAVNKKSEVENNRYGSGAVPVSLDEKNYGLINLKPCGTLFSFSQDKKPEIRNVHP